MKPIATYQKLRGGYYTPKPIADFLGRWAIQASVAEVLEPSCGDGIVLQAAAEALIERGASAQEVADCLHGVEFDRQEAQKAANRLRLLDVPSAPGQIHTGDFFTYCKSQLANKRQFDAVIGNPPFIRYQNFPEDQRVTAFGLMARVGLKPNRLTNSWVPFLVASSLLLKPHGRLAMVIPAELLQVNYAAQLRRFLSEYYSNITLITFKKLVFEGIQQEIVLLLGERNGHEHTGIRTIELDGVADLAAYEHTEFSRDNLKPMYHSSEKWTQYFLDQPEIELLRTLRYHPNLTIAGDVIDVDVGIVTGLNEFFVLNEQQIKQHDLEAHTQPIVGRSGHIQGVIFAESDWASNVEKQLPAFLLAFPDLPFDRLPKPVQDYVASGEQRQFHTGYKCRIRNRWYILPSLWAPDAFMLRQIHHYPRIIVNQAHATSTDTIHRVRLRNGTKVEVIALGFLNSLTFAFSEVIGRSYGGGVLELEPNEAELLPLPLKGADQLDLDHINQLLLSNQIDAVLDITDRVLLIDGAGLTMKEAMLLRGIWKKLRNRRVNRK